LHRDLGRSMTDEPVATSDASLVERMVAGDQAAFTAIYDRHVDVVYGSVTRFLGDRGAAEEIVQDAFLAIWRRADTYLPGAGSVLGWLLGIARNKAIDRMRASARRPRLVATSGAGDDRSADGLDALLAAGLPVATGMGEEDDPERAATQAWTRAVVRAALSAMPGPERQALELAYDEDLTQTQIAERLGWPLGTVKTRTRRGLDRLRGALESVPDLVVDHTGTRIGRGPGAAFQLDAKGAPDAAR
jgi:RNA polymerase sigma-70 factor (ECF subfamily)